MPFSQSVKDEAKERAHYHCVWCQETAVRIEVHHIVPESEGGADDIDNAAPLCPNCHADYDANPDLRRAIRKRRDWMWQRFRETEEQYPSVYAEAKPFLRRLDEIHQAVEEGREEMETLKENQKKYFDWKRDRLSSADTWEEFQVVSNTT